MRLLIGFPNRIEELVQGKSLPGRETAGDEILCFGKEYQDIPYKPGISWRALLAACPAGWRPDVYIHWSPEYNSVPQGVEAAECLTVGVLGDWNLGGHALRAVGDLFDVLVADRNGVEALRRAGYAQTLPAQLWGYDPSLHRRLPDVARDLDIVMIGSFNHTIQSARAPWLARIARMADRYRVLLDTGVHGSAYVLALNRARIVFNYAVRGEINMRAYEAPACGAVLFQEAHNTEIASLYTPGKEVILYRDDDLEALLDHCLTHEAERAAIAEAGYRAVQPHTYARHLGDLLSAIEASGFHIAQRPFLCRTPRQQKTRLALHWLKACEPLVLPHTDALLAQALRRGEATGDRTPAIWAEGAEGTSGAIETRKSEVECQAELLLMRACVAGEWARCLVDPTMQRRTFEGATRLAEQALRLDPALLAARFSLAFLKLEMGDFGGGMALMAELTATLEQLDPAPYTLRGPFYPRAFAGYDVAIDRVWMCRKPGSPEWAVEVSAILRSHLHAALAELYHARQEYHAAAEHAGRSVTLGSEFPEPWLLLARAQRAQGCAEAALAAYGEALVRLPFLPSAQEERARLLLDLGRNEEAATVLQDWLIIVGAMPIYAALTPGLEALLHRAETLQQDPQPPICRLLALPNWRNPQEWQALVRVFAETYTANDPVLLMLRADPLEAPPAHRLLQELGGFLQRDLALNPAMLPHITLLNEPLAPEDRWKQVHVADALISANDLPPVWSALALAVGKPVWSLEDLSKSHPRGVCDARF